MMRLALGLPAIAALLVSTASATALESKMTVSSSLSPDALWRTVGSFCEIPSWNPFVQKCVLSVDSNQRTITLVGGPTVIEVLEKWDNADHSYTYKTKSGPLPVENYQTIVRVMPNDLQPLTAAPTLFIIFDRAVAYYAVC
jgi:Polyketide cyclase / dehydrase and lipid transport